QSKACRARGDFTVRACKPLHDLARPSLELARFRVQTLVQIQAHDRRLIGVKEETEPVVSAFIVRRKRSIEFAPCPWIAGTGIASGYLIRPFLFTPRRTGFSRFPHTPMWKFAEAIGNVARLYFQSPSLRFGIGYR